MKKSIAGELKKGSGRRSGQPEDAAVATINPAALDAAPGEEARSPAAPCVVGIGASAGGFEAIRNLFQAMPADSGMAFVVIQHLNPGQRSFAVELFGKMTSMAVAQVEEGMRVEANHVYTPPPGMNLEIRGGLLHLIASRESCGQRLPIDHFFHSLGEDQHQRAIGIILSGTCSDGTLGLRSIAANGGMVLAQDPAQAQFDGMPRSAISTGQVNYVLAVEKMPEALIGYARHPYVAGEAVVDAEEGSVAAILDLLRVQRGYNFGGYKRKMLIRRIQRRMGLKRVEKMADYVPVLHKDPDEIDALFKDMLIGVTEFFRDAEAWKMLAAEVIAPLIESNTGDEPIRAWVAGAATGEEAYSLAMLILEKLKEMKKRCPVQIFATDTNEEALAVGRAGIYPAGIAAHVSPARLRRFFVEIKDGHQYQVGSELREAVIFGVQNLLGDPPFSRLDLVTCRNLMIYLEPDTQKKIIPLFHFSLKPDGYLFLGTAETIGQRDNLFKPVSKRWHIYRRIGVTPRDQIDWHLTAGWPRAVTAGLAGQRPVLRAAQAESLAKQLILDRFAPAAVLVNSRYEAVYFCGSADRYLAQRRGAPTQDLLALVRDGLRSHLRTALRQALAGDKTVVVHDVRVKRGNEFVAVKFTVTPVAGSDVQGALLLVVFEDEPQPAPTPASGVAETALVRQLEEELRVTKDDLQSTIERLEASNEELKVSNEEVISGNEELQSINEELESSKEELHSLNEELNTVNQQLQTKVADLETVNNDLKNLLDSSDIATICLDRGFHIKWFTPATREIFNMLATDIGRSINDFAPILSGGSLLKDAQAVLDRLTPMQAELKSGQGRWYIRRILPYRTEDHHIDGVIVTFTDISESKRAAEVAIEARKTMTASLEQRVEERTMQLRALAFELTMAEERERRAVALDLHDSLGQMLAIAKLKLDTLLQAPEAKVAKMAIMEVDELIRQAGRVVRSLTFQLSPPVLYDLGLVPALDWLAEEMKRVYGLAVEVHDDGRPKPLDQAARSIVFRAVRELLINVAKHAKVGTAQVNIQRSGDRMTITVTDAGTGFDQNAMAKPSASGGFGLFSVRERLVHLGGSAEIASIPGDGTEARLTVLLST